MIDLRTGNRFNSTATPLDDVTPRGNSLTRREALKGGLAAILATGMAPALCGSITRGMQYRNLAGRMAAMVGGGKDKIHGFIKEGLIAYWDGIDNAGLGDEHHQSTLTVWKNLVGDADLYIANTSLAHIGNYYIGFTGNYGYSNIQNGATPITIEYDVFPRSFVNNMAYIDWRVSSSSNYNLLTHYSYNITTSQRSEDYLYVINGTTGKRALQFGMSTTDTDVWYRFCFVLGSEYTKIYKNGVLIASSDTIVSSYGPLGYLQVNKYGNNMSPMTSVSSIRIYNRLLSEREIIENDNASTNRFGIG